MTDTLIKARKESIENKHHKKIDQNQCLWCEITIFQLITSSLPDVGGHRTVLQKKKVTIDGPILSTGKK